MTPELLIGLPLATAIVAGVLPGSWPRHSVNAFGALATAVAGILLAATVFSSGPLGDQWFYVDALGAYLLATVAVIGAAAALYSIPYLQHDVRHGEIPTGRIGWYYLWLHVFIATMLLVCMLRNLGLLWAAVEATTLASAMLVGFYGRHTSLEAAWKYLLLCTAGIMLALFGILLLYATSAHAIGEGLSSLDWTHLLTAAGQLDPALVKLAFVFVLIGFGTKAGLAPMHTWLPDAHSQAPAPISAVLSGVLLACAVYAILRFHTLTAAVVGPAFSSNLLLIFGLISVAVSAPFILVQRDVKRLLAYSSVEHIGIAVAAIGIGGPLGLFGGLLHLANHAIAKALLFFVAGELTQRYGTRAIGGIRGAVQVMPVTGPALLLGIFAITGAPPFGLFLSELTIIQAGFAEGRAYASAGLLIGITVIFAGLLYHTIRMTFGVAPARVPIEGLQPFRVLALALPLLALAVLGISVPAEFSDAVQQSALVVAGGR